MYEYKPVTAEEAAPLQLRLEAPDCHPETGAYLRDAYTRYVGASLQGSLVGLARLVSVDRDGRPSLLLARLEGPFWAPGHSACHDGVLAAALRSVRPPCGVYRARPKREPSDGYSADDIIVLEGLTAVRMRPGMYVGSVGADGVLAMLHMLLSDAVWSHRRGEATTLSVSFDGSGWEVSDNGAGIPAQPHPMLGKMVLEVLCETLSTGGFPSGRGAGLSTVNGLSASLQVASEGLEKAYVYGVAASFCGPSAELGHRVRFVPDEGLFSSVSVAPEAVTALLRSIAALNPGLSVSLDGAPVEVDGGLLALAEDAAGGPLADVRLLEAGHGEVRVRGVLGWRPDGEPLTRLWLHGPGWPLRSAGLLRQLEGAGLLDGLAAPGRVLALAVADGQERTWRAAPDAGVLAAIRAALASV